MSPAAAAVTTSAHAARLSCASIDVAVAGRLLVKRLDIAFHPGQVTAILGRNGSGKTLSLHTLAGLRAPQAGEVRLDDVSLAQRSRRERACALGLLTQTTEDTFPSTVLEAVLVGRHPHLGFWEWEGDEDRAIARAALHTVQLAELEDRDVATLSGGERRRVALAALLTQDPAIYLLDEPTNHLDPHHQIDLLHLMRTKAASGRTIIMTLHDATLAARFADNVLLLFGDGEWSYGSVTQTLTQAAMSKLYGLPVREIEWDGGRTFVMGI